MKQANSEYRILNTVYKAFYGLRLLFDPSVEGDPYIKENNFTPWIKEQKEVKNKFWFGRRWAIR